MKKFFKTIGWALSLPFVFIAFLFNLLSVTLKANKYVKNPDEVLIEDKMKAIYKLFKKVLYFKRIEVVAEGFETLPSKQLIYLPNHKDFCDPIYLFVALYESNQLQDLSVVAKAELKKHKILTPSLKLLNGILIQRDDPRSIYDCYLKQGEQIKNGKSILVFPEGTRNIDHDEFLEFKPAVLDVAFENYVTIAPIAIYGANHKRDKHEGFKHKVYITALKPIQPNVFITTKPVFLMPEIQNRVWETYCDLKVKAEIEKKGK